MELVHLIGIGIGLLILCVFLVWLVWSCFCSEKSEEYGNDEEDEESEESRSFSSTHVITSGKRCNGKWKRSGNESCGSTDEEGDGGKCGDVNKKEKRSSYRYQTNKYGLDDPFGEWTPKKNILQLPSTHLSPVYPKSPSLRHKTFNNKQDYVIEI